MSSAGQPTDPSGQGQKSSGAASAASVPGGKVTAVSVARVGADQFLLIKLDQPIPANASELQLDMVLDVVPPPATSDAQGTPGAAPAGGPMIPLWCICNRNKSDVCVTRIG